ncbi:lipoprotein [Paraburkholderia caffeinilytica]|nr:lipoprotein [Paraburkholderia caffeinilytica]
MQRLFWPPRLAYFSAFLSMQIKRQIFAAAAFKKKRSRLWLRLYMGETSMTSTRPARLLTSVLAAAITCVAALTAAPAFAQAVIVAPMAPPPPRVEVMPAPRAGYVWDQGRWRWDHGRYVWVPGHWRPVRVGYRWVPGHWVQRGPNWRWVEGHWA